MTRRFARTIVIATAALLGIATAQAADKYPSHTVRIISTTPAGGPRDAMARLIAQELSSKLGQTFIVENRPGANTTIGAHAAAMSPPDGYTLLMATDSTLSISPHLYSRLPYSPDDFEAVAQMVEWGSHLYVNAQLPVHSLKEFIAYATSRPGKLNYGSYGHGSNPVPPGNHIRTYW